MSDMKGLDGTMGGWFRKTVLDPALWITFVLSLAIAFLGDERVLRSASVAVGSAQVQIGIVFLGIVLAGLSILVVFLDEEYIALLEQVAPGIDADLWPFKYAAFIAVVCAALGMALIVLGEPAGWAFRLVFLFALWSFSYLLWTMFELVRFVAGHAKARVRQIQNRNHSE